MAQTKSLKMDRCCRKVSRFPRKLTASEPKKLDNFLTLTDFWEEEEESCRPSSEVCCNYSEREPNVVFEGDVVSWLSISWRSSIVSRSRGRTSLLGRLRWTLWTSAVYQGQYGVGKWVPASAGKAKAGILRFIPLADERGVCRWKMCDPLRTRAIPERLRGVFTTRRYTNPRLPYLYGLINTYLIAYHRRGG